MEELVRPPCRTRTRDRRRRTDPPSEDSTATVSFQGPTRAQTGIKKSWTLSCFQPNGKLHGVEEVEVARGERADVGKTCRKDKKQG